MIFLENGDEVEQISAERLAEIMGIDTTIVEKLRKNPVFEVNPALTKPDKLNGGIIAPAGRASKPYFFKKIGGIMHVIRYADSVVPDKVNPRISTYSPTRLWFYDQLEIVQDFDLALFKYCLPACGDSPEKSQNWHYSFQNKEAKALKTTERAAKIGKALSEINGGMSDADIWLVAKGIYAQNSGHGRVIPNPSAANKTVAEVKADLTELALRDPDLFLNSCDDRINEFYGMVLDAVDRKIFEIRISGAVKSWFWNFGPLKDNKICDIPGGANDFDQLRSTIEADPNKYYANVVKAVKDHGGKESLANFIHNNNHDPLVMNEEPVIDHEKEALRKQVAEQDDRLKRLESVLEGLQSKPTTVKAPEGPEVDLFANKSFEQPKEENEGYVPMHEKVTPKYVVPSGPSGYNDSRSLMQTISGEEKINNKHIGIFWAWCKQGDVTSDNMVDKVKEALAVEI